MAIFILFLFFVSNSIQSMNTELPQPTILKQSKQDDKAYSYSSYLEPDDFEQKPVIFDNDSSLTGELINSIYLTAPETVHEFITAVNANFKSNESFPVNCLLTGPSGCGKTSLAKVMAIKMNRPYKLIKAPLLFDRYKNSTIEKLMNCINTYLLNKEKCVLIFDEINAITDKQEIKNDQDSTASSAFWLLLDDCFASNKIFVIGTTNKKASDLPAQFQTRFAGDSIINVCPPNLKARFSIIKLYLNQESHNCSDRYINKIAKRTANKSTREIKALINQAARKASCRDALSIVIKEEDVETIIKSWPSRWRVSFSYETLKPYLQQLPSHVLQIALFYIGYRFQIRTFDSQHQNSKIQLDLQKEGLEMQSNGMELQKELAAEQRSHSWWQFGLNHAINIANLIVRIKTDL